jgi:hypothetical protein
MRSRLLVSLVFVVALGACGSQSLTSSKSGSGGMGGGGPGTGGQGANTSATGGSSGGTGGQSVCDTLVMAYQAAVRAAQSCAIGGTGQCQQVVPLTLSVCGSCPTYVNDPTNVNAIQQAWQAANCSKNSPPVPCALIECPAALNNVCAENPDDTTGTTGICSYVPPSTGGTGGSATGGSSGAGGSSPDGGLSSCSELTTQYAAALAASKSCDIGASGQCAQQVPASLAVCSGGCTEYVNDATTLNQIQLKWNQAGCGNVAVLCPAIACLQPYAGVCVATDGGSKGTCLNTEPVGLL